MIVYCKNLFVYRYLIIFVNKKGQKTKKYFAGILDKAFTYAIM